MGKEKNLKKRHRANKRNRRREIRDRYLAVREGRVKVDNKQAELERLARLLVRRGWQPPEEPGEPAGG